MWPFKPSPFLDPDERAWMIETGEWVMNAFGGRKQVLETPLVLPTAEFFDLGAEREHARAEHIFSQVKELAGMAEWPCVLEEQPDAPQPRVGEITTLQLHNADPGGTFGIDGDGGRQQILITYNPADLNNPIALIATFAHELAHYLMNSQQSAPPGGWELHEPATDYLAVFMGFGIFLANSAFVFTQYTDTMSQGWQSQRRGYLSETQLVYALAQFLSLKDLDERAARMHLKTHLRGQLRKALAELGGDSDWAKASRRA